MHISGIDTARALAALSVVFAHLLSPSMPGLTKYIFTGHPAVIAFFVISGFCIHFPFRDADLVATTFLKRRFVRIGLPTLAAFIWAQLAGIRAYNPIDGYILWSVVCEMIYYSLYPIFLPLSRKIGWPKMILASVVVSYVIVLALGSDEYGNAHIYGAGLNWLVGLPAWLIGCFIAQHYRSGMNLGSIWLWRAGTAFTASVLYWATINTPAGYYLTMTPFAALAGGWMLAEASSAERGHAIQAMEKIGKACFSIYLIHAIAAFELEHRGLRNPLLVTGLALAMVYPFYRYVEKPAHDLSRSLGRKRSSQPTAL
ncbi:acyltransferase family protein [Neorhizobium galegae]|nr:acyltransferase [Neorhizobium galegae]MCQ1851322.1 acyltransferase [Neorhizobium galegae]